MKSFLSNTISKYRSLLVGVSLFPILLTSQGTNALAQAEELSLRSVSYQQEGEITTSENQSQDSYNQIWTQNKNFDIDDRYQINSEIKAEAPIDWNTIEIGISSDYQFNFYAVKF